jgi:type IV pilus assembly protein PilO
MATSGVMADFARMPTSRKVGVFAVIGLVLGFLYFRLVYKPLSSELDALRNEHQGLVATNNKLSDQLKKYPALKEEMKRLTRRNEENQKALPTQAEVPAFFETLERKVRESGIEITKWTKLPEEPVEEFVKVPVDIEVTGTFMQLKRFFASLVPKRDESAEANPDGVIERERIVSIENLTIREPVARNREIVLVAKFRAVTFRQENPTTDTPANALPPARAPGDAAKAPPLPSAATPAGAKARTEDALQKQDDKNRLKGGL